MRTFLRTLLCLTIVLVSLNTPVRAEGAKPVLHVLAPPLKHSDAYDPLAPEAAVRLLAARLAAQHGRHVKFWPLDQLDRVPKDAFPRLQLTPKRLQNRPHLRLRRRGDRFDFLVSADARSYARIGQLDIRMPKRTYVGLAAWGWDEGISGKATVPLLNGKPGAAWKEAHIGDRPQDNRIQRTKDLWTLENKGFYRLGDYRNRVPFVYTPAEGDFDLDAKIESIADDRKNGVIGLMCRSEVALDAATIELYAGKNYQSVGLRGPGYPHSLLFFSRLAFDVEAVLWTAPGKKKMLFVEPVFIGTWKDFSEGAAMLSKRAFEAVAGELKLDVSIPNAPLRAAAGQLKTLAEARKLLTTGVSGKILEASRRVDEILNTSPTCIEAHYTAAMCGAVLACQDLYGGFHQRPRFLAGPMAHWMLARRLGKPSRPEETLAEAWVLLAAGFPAEAAKKVESVRDASDLGAELQALRMFITRDYRPIKPETIRQATGVEQLAWLWATQQAGRSDLIKRVPQELAMHRGSFAFLPVYTNVGVGAGHVFSPLGVQLAMARDSVDLLRCSDIPEPQRKAVAEKLIEATDADSADDMDRQARNVALAFITERTDLSDSIAAMLELYDAALKKPAGPVTTGTTGALQWQSLGVHDFAELQRGLFMMALYRRASFMGHMYGVPRGTQQFCDEAAEGLTALPGAADYFKSFGLAAVHKVDESKEAAYKAVKTPFGYSLVARSLMIENWPNNALRDVYKKIFYRYGVRGSWDWGLAAEATSRIGESRYCLNLALACLPIDPSNARSVRIVSWLTESTAVAEPYVARMPYHSSLIRGMAWKARHSDELESAIAFYKQLLELAPKDINNYYDLAVVYAGRDQREDAIKVAGRARDNCEWTVGLSNLLGKAAVWSAREGKSEQALEFGKQGARSYSYRGLEGLAEALAVNDRKEEARNTFRAIAQRYDTGAKGFTAFMIRQGYDDDVIIKEIAGLVKGNADMKEKIGSLITDGFVNEPGHNDLLEKAFAGPLSFMARDEQYHILIVNSQNARKFDELIGYSAKLAEVKDRSVYQTIWTHNAARLAKRPDAVKEMTAELRKHVEDKKVGAHVRYLLGEVNREQLLDGLRKNIQKSYAYWIFGVDAEVKGDIPAALKAYKTASDVDITSQSTWAPKTWSDQIKAERRPTTQPAGK